MSFIKIIIIALSLFGFTSCGVEHDYPSNCKVVEGRLICPKANPSDHPVENVLNVIIVD